MPASAYCRVCCHQDRARIEMLAITGASHVALAKQFKPLSRYSIDRHLARHVTPERRVQLLCGPIKLRELVDRASDEGMSLLDYLKVVRSALLSQFLAASEASDRNGVALLAGRLTQIVKLTAEITGELVKAPLVNIDMRGNDRADPVSPGDAARTYRDMLNLPRPGSPQYDDDSGPIDADSSDVSPEPAPAVAEQASVSPVVAAPPPEPNAGAAPSEPTTTATAAPAPAAADLAPAAPESPPLPPPVDLEVHRLALQLAYDGCHMPSIRKRAEEVVAERRRNEASLAAEHDRLREQLRQRELRLAEQEARGL